MDDVAHLIIFANSITLGLLIGFERERHPGAKAGVRTFALIAFAGTLFAYLGQELGTPWVLIAMALVVGLSLITAYSRVSVVDDDPGTTTVVAGLLTFGLGAMLWFGQSTLATALAIMLLALLYFRTELHGVAQKLTQRDYLSFLQFAALAFVLLPVLPNRTYDPLNALNPYRIGWLVVLISGVSLAGYIALRIFGQRRGLIVAGLFGGLASTTATTLVFARKVKQNSNMLHLSTSVILLANLILYLRIGFFVAVMAPDVLRALAPALVGGLLGGGLYIVWTRHRGQVQMQSEPPLEIDNPVELRAALGFALLFSVVMLGSAWMNNTGGLPGLYSAAFISGLADLDAITLSILRLGDSADIAPMQAANAIFAAFIANFCFKGGLAVFSGSLRLGSAVAKGFAAMVIGMMIGLWAEIIFA